MDKLKDLTLLELEPYICGKKFTGKANKPILLTSAVNDFRKYLAQYPNAKSVFDLTEMASDFYKLCPDFVHYFDKDIRLEVYYAAKIGGYYKGIPCYCAYMLKKAFAEVEEIPNLIPKVLPLPVLEQFLREDYFLGGLTLRDAICNVCTPNYTPLSEHKLTVKHDSFYEVYIRDTDMVAAIPSTLMDIIPEEELCNIVVKGKDMYLHDHPVRTLGGYVGAINSCYDLRALL